MAKNYAGINLSNRYQISDFRYQISNRYQSYADIKSIRKITQISSCSRTLRLIFLLLEKKNLQKALYVLSFKLLGKEIVFEHFTENSFINLSI